MSLDDLKLLGGTVPGDDAGVAPDHIEGLTAGERPSDVLAGVPLISRIQPGLWMGGCINACVLPDEIGFVLSLYPWERYELNEGVDRLEVRLYDSDDLPPAYLIDGLAWIVNHKIAELDALNGKEVLVHCQAGLNRSGLITARALMMQGATSEDAISLLRERRDPYVLCNKTFEAYLHACQLEAIGAQEWGVMTKDGQVHREGMSEREARGWLEEWVGNGGEIGMFHSIRRQNGLWVPA